jgi:hypothetical protein
VSVLSPVRFVPHVPESPIFATIYANYQEQTLTGSLTPPASGTLLRLVIDETPAFTLSGRGLWIPNGYAVTMLVEYWGASYRHRIGTGFWTNATTIRLNQAVMRASRDGAAEENYGVLVAPDTPSIYSNFRFRFTWDIAIPTGGTAVNYEFTRRVALRLFLHPLFRPPTLDLISVEAFDANPSGRDEIGGDVAPGGGSGPDEGGTPPGDPGPGPGGDGGFFGGGGGSPF